MMGEEKKYSYLYRNGLTITFLTLFIITLLAQAFTGWKVYNEELEEAHQLGAAFGEYLFTGHFVSATFENFESEFLQMSLYVILTVSLRQIGSAESKPLDKIEEVDKIPKPSANAPWSVKKGGWILKIYENSLSVCFLLLFLISWALHLLGSWKEYNVEQSLHHQLTIGLANYLLQPKFWFETFQNWQSEFLSVASIVFFTIYLRQKGSPESKSVDAPHMKTGK